MFVGLPLLKNKISYWTCAVKREIIPKETSLFKFSQKISKSYTQFKKFQYYKKYGEYYTIVPILNILFIWALKAEVRCL